MANCVKRWFAVYPIPHFIASFSEGSRNGNAQEEINSEPFDPEQLLWFHSATEAGGADIRAHGPRPGPWVDAEA